MDIWTITGQVGSLNASMLVANIRIKDYRNVFQQQHVSIARVTIAAMSCILMYVRASHQAFIRVDHYCSEATRPDHQDA
jgi:hypothetical protein